MILTDLAEGHEAVARASAPHICLGCEANRRKLVAHARAVCITWLAADALRKFDAWVALMRANPFVKGARERLLYESWVHAADAYHHAGGDVCLLLQPDG